MVTFEQLEQIHKEMVACKRARDRATSEWGKQYWQSQLNWHKRRINSDFVLADTDGQTV